MRTAPGGRSTAFAGSPDTRRYEDVDIGFLVFVCGPSSVGKSSFIRQLIAGTLPDQIKELLPAGVEKWERLEPKNFAGVAAPEAKDFQRQFKPGLIFHYDTMRIHNRGWESYGDDRALDIFHAARKTLLIDIRAPRAILEKHWVSRIARQKPPRGFRRLLKNFKRVVLRRSYVPENVVRAEFSALEAYRDEKWVKDAYSRWETFLSDVSAGGRDIDILRLEPISRANSEPGFRLCSGPPKRVGGLSAQSGLA